MTAAEPDGPYRPHVVSDFDVTTEQVSPDRSISVAPLVDAVRNCAGAAALGYLAALVDVNCALVALIAAAPSGPRPPTSRCTAWTRSPSDPALSTASSSAPAATSSRSQSRLPTAAASTRSPSAPAAPCPAVRPWSPPAGW